MTNRATAILPAILKPNPIKRTTTYEQALDFRRQMTRQFLDGFVRSGYADDVVLHELLGAFGLGQITREQFWRYMHDSELTDEDIDEFLRKPEL